MNTHFEILAVDGAALLQRSGPSMSQWLAMVAGGNTKDRPSNPYSQVAAVYACVSARADAIASMPLMLSTASDQVIQDGPQIQLARQPNERQTGRDFWKATEAMLCLFGRCYWVRDDKKGQPVTELYVYSPLQIKPVTKADGELVGYVYKPRKAAQEVSLSLEQVHVISEPDYQAMGEESLSPATAAAMAIAQFYKADLANESSLDNDVAPSGALSVPATATLTDQQRQGLRSELAESHAGSRNRRRFMLLEGGIDWKQMGASFTEMEFSELKKLSRTDICSCFRVPPSVAGYYEADNYAHAEASQEMFWTNLVLPRSVWLAEQWDMAVGASFRGDTRLGSSNARSRQTDQRQRCQRTYRAARARAMADGRDLYAWFDASSIAAVQQAQLKLAQQAQVWIDKGVPLNQIISAYDLPFEEQEWGNTWWRPFGLIDVQDESATLPGADDPPGSAPDDDTDDAPAPAPAPGSGPDRAVLPDHVRRLSSAQLERLWMSWRSSWTGIEKAFTAKVTRHQIELRRETLRRLQEVMGPVKGMAVQKRDLVGRILFDLIEARKRIDVMTMPLVRAGYKLGGDQVMAEAAAAAGQSSAARFNVDDPQLLDSMRGRQIRIRATDDTLHRRLGQQLTLGLEKQETVTQLAERVRSEFNFAARRAVTIARTEVGGAVEDARQIGRVQAQVPAKSWLWSRKETGRPWHQETEAITMARPIPNEANFTLPKTGASTPYPRGPGLQADDAANCGCTTLIRYPDDQVADARVFDYLTTRGFLSATLETRHG